MSETSTAIKGLDAIWPAPSKFETEAGDMYRAIMAQTRAKGLGYQFRYESPFSTEPIEKKVIPTNKLLLLCN